MNSTYEKNSVRNFQSEMSITDICIKCYVSFFFL